MNFVDKLSFAFGSKLPSVLQTEAAECGLACLTMIAGYHGFRTDLSTLRRDHSLSLMGATLTHLIQIAQKLNLATRPLKLDMEGLGQLRLPCILHWDFNHFVVLKEVGPKTVTIHDPALGVRKLTLEEVSQAFTGVAMECWPNPGFKRQNSKKEFRLADLIGPVDGLYRSLGQVLLLALALEVFELLNPLFMQWLIDEAIVSADHNLVTSLAIGFGILMLMRQCVSALRHWVLIYISTTLNVQWRANVFSHLLRLPMQYFERRHLGDIVSRFESVDHIQKTLTTSFIEAILDGMMTIITLAMMFVYSPTLAMIAVGAMVIYFLVRVVWYTPLYRASEEEIVHQAKQESHFLETMRGVKAIKLYQKQDDRRVSWLALVVDQTNAHIKTERLTLLYRLVNGVLFGLEGILILWLGSQIVIGGGFTVGVLMAFVAYKDQFSTRVTSLIDKWFQLQMLRLQGERLGDVVFTEPEILEGKGKGLQHEELAPTIELRDVHFRYAEGEASVLNGVNLKIEAGESVAITGPSGCGKSTLMNLILGTLQPTSGQILLGGVDIRHIGIDALRSVVGTVLQDDVLFAGSIADNISFFDQNADMDWIMQCAEYAAVDGDIERMPMAYNTLVGDMGTVLSGGQKQRILMARALYKQPSILFLDEATSSLDIEREASVNASVQSLNMTRIIIAHRLDTIASADRIVVLQNGRVTRSHSRRIDGEIQVSEEEAVA